MLGDVGRLASPQRLYIVDNVILIGVYILAIFPLFNLAKCDGHGQEVAIFLQELLHLLILAILLAVV